MTATDEFEQWLEDLKVLLTRAETESLARKSKAYGYIIKEYNDTLGRLKAYSTSIPWAQHREYIADVPEIDRSTDFLQHNNQAERAKFAEIIHNIQTAIDKLARTVKERRASEQAEAAVASNPRLAVTEKSLREIVKRISSPDTRTFLEEAVGCLENRLFRAAVVLSWVGAVSLMHRHVHANHLSAFNAAASARNPKWKNAVDLDDLGKIKESEFLEIADVIGVIDKNVKQDLQGALQLRNACGHPSGLIVGENKAAAHIETLILNVYEKFA